MSWDNPVFPIDTKNSIGFFVQFFWGQPGLVGDSVSQFEMNAEMDISKNQWRSTGGEFDNNPYEKNYYYVNKQ